MKILVDCTDIAFHGGNTGIQRVARNLARHASMAAEALNFDSRLVALFPPTGFVQLEEPTPNGLSRAVGTIRLLAYHGRNPRHFRRLCTTLFQPLGITPWIERQWRGHGKLPLIAILLFPVYSATAFALFAAPWLPPPRRVVEPSPKDILVIPGSSWWGRQMKGWIPKLRDESIRIVPLIHDLFPVSHPEIARDDLIHSFCDNIDTLLESSTLVMTNSRFTAKLVEKHIQDNAIEPAPHVSTFPMGIELDLANNNRLPRKDLVEIFNKTTFLSVGTVEPRKNYDLLLDSFEILWKSYPRIHLVIVGKKGWKSQRTCERITSLIDSGHQIHWFQDLNDSELAWCYKHARALVYPSLIEGFGLPLQEALLHGCPVLASDIPVFHEIGRENCRYFPPDNQEILAQMIEEWSIDPPSRPQADWPDWKESALEFFRIISDHSLS